MDVSQADAFLRAMARRYVWDQSEAEALANPARIIRRVMDLGVLEDALELEPALGRARLVDVLRTSPAGAMRPRSWWFWHYRLGLVDAAQDPPPMPVRGFGSRRPEKISPNGRVGTPSRDDDGHLLLVSLDDLLGHKLKVLLQRVEAKDYRDIAALLDSGTTLERGLGAARALFPNFPPCEAVKALVYFGDGDLASLSAEDRAILVGHVDRFTKAEAVALLSTALTS